jgi:hypothetical protein
MLWAIVGSKITVGIVVPVLIGIGVGVMSMTPPDFVVAKIAFCAASLVLALRVAWWLGIELPDGTSRAHAIIFAFIVFGAIGALWFGSLVWVDGRHALSGTQPPAADARTKTAERQPTPVLDKPPTLDDLFKSDFPNVIKATDTDRIGVQWKDGSVLHVKTQVYIDFPARVQFAGFYVPSSPKSYEACIRLADAVREIIDDLPKRSEMMGGYRGEMNKLQDLIFSGRVLLYHEDFLSIKQKAAIIDAYAAKHCDVQFRGPDYLGDHVIAWHHQHAAKEAH